MQDVGAEVSRATRPTGYAAGPSGIGGDGIIPGIKVRAPKRDPKAIWDDDEVPEVVMDEMDDGRVRPEHDVFVKQAVGTGDVFLGLSGKDTSSGSCETLVVEVRLPGARGAREIDLDVQPTYLRVTSRDYKLGTFLPHRVDAERGKAEWDGGKEVLRLQLPIVREWDDVLRGAPGMDD